MHRRQTTDSSFLSSDKRKNAIKLIICQNVMCPKCSSVFYEIFIENYNKHWDLKRSLGFVERTCCISVSLEFWYLVFQKRHEHTGRVFVFRKHTNNHWVHRSREANALFTPSFAAMRGSVFLNSRTVLI